MHVPPFLQGFPRQSLMSMTKSQQLLLKTFFIHKSKLGWVIARHFLRKTRYSPFLHAQEQLIASVFKPGKNSTCVLSLTCIKTNRSIKFPLEKNIQKYLSSRYRHVCIETGLRSVFTHRGKHEPLQKTVFFFYQKRLDLKQYTGNDTLQLLKSSRFTLCCRASKQKQTLRRFRSKTYLLKETPTYFHDSIFQ